MLEVTIALNNMQVKLKNPTSETIEDCIDLVQTAASWVYGQTIDLDLYEEADETIYCEGEEPSDEREIEGL
jgi:hypothetical protein